MSRLFIIGFFNAAILLFSAPNIEFTMDADNDNINNNDSDRHTIDHNDVTEDISDDERLIIDENDVTDDTTDGSTTNDIITDKADKPQDMNIDKDQASMISNDDVIICDDNDDVIFLYELITID